MGKGNQMVVLSLEDEDDEDFASLMSSRSNLKSKSRSSGGSRTNPRASKRARLSDARAKKEPSHVDEVRLSFEGFEEALSGSKVSAGHQSSKKTDLWLEKYMPRTLEELAVHKKKVEEVKLWFEASMGSSKDGFRNNVLLLTGQAGVGKSATIHVIASILGVTVYEWNAPIPTVWHEHVHNSSSGLKYTSKLDEFENFVENTRKYGLIASSCIGGSKKRIVLLIDDLPLTNGRLAFERLQNCLILLAKSTQTPTVILLTDYDKQGSSDQTVRSMGDVQSSLERAGACKVAFNPITKNSIKKTLGRICREEHCKVNSVEIDQLASASGGDIRHAITSLQLFSVKPEINFPKIKLPRHGMDSSYLGDRQTMFSGLDDSISSGFGRDETLSLFHALGKFLHCKRETDNVFVSDCSDFLVHDQFARLPLKMDAPEKVLSQAHGQAGTVVDFLHENVLDFLSDEAIEDTWSMSLYLSDADVLLAAFKGKITGHNKSEDVLQSAGVSVAVRGVLYGNKQPRSSRWHVMRRPKLWQVEQFSVQTKKKLMEQRRIGYKWSRVGDISVMATEYNPRVKWLGERAAPEWSANAGMEEEERDVSDSESCEDDEIQDW